MKKSLVNKVLLGLVVSGNVIWGGTAVHAEEQPQFMLDEIVVTASRTEQKEFETNADITVITQDDIQKHHYQSVQDAIKKVPGVYIMSYTPVDNYTSNGIYINGTSNITYLVDGMRANTNGSTFNKAPLSEFVNMDNIERIEILKGSASTLYGSDAQGGVINIITKVPEDGSIKTKIGFTTGSYNLKQYNFAHSGSENGYNWSINAQKRRMGDFKDAWGNKVVSDMDSNDLGLKLGKKLSDYADITIKYNKYQNDYQRPGGGSLDPNRQYGEKNNAKVSLIYNQKINDSINNKFSIFRNTNLLKDNIYGDLWFMDLATEGFSDQLTYSSENNTLIVGYDYYKDKVDKYESTSNGITTGYSNKSLSNKAVFMQDEFKFGKGFSVTPGIRYDKHSTYGSHTTPSVVIGYNCNNKTNFYVGYKEFFVAPNQFQVFSAYGSKELQPEEGKTWEFGVKHKFDDTFNGSIRLYKQHAENLVGYRSITVAPYIQYYNMGEQKSKGFDVNLNKKINDNLNAYVSYSYLNMDAKPGKNRNDNGRLPMGTWNIGLGYDNKKFDADFRARGVINRDGNAGVDVDHDHYVTYWVFDLGTNYKPNKDIKIFLNVNNLFNKLYSEYGTAGRPSIKNWYAMPGRNFQVGVEYSF